MSSSSISCVLYGSIFRFALLKIRAQNHARFAPNIIQNSHPKIT
ncbi:hypothetical protein ACWIUD_09220 [Helicobacter sp. 23-1044]